MGAGVGWEKGKQAGFFGTPLFRKRLRLAKKRKEDWKWLLKGLGNDNPLNKGMGGQWWVGAQAAGRKKMAGETESRCVRGKEYPGLGDDQDT